MKPAAAAFAVIAAMLLWRWFLTRKPRRRHYVYDAPFTLLEDPYLESLRDCGT